MAQNVTVTLDRLNIARLSARFARKKVDQVTRDIEVRAKIEARGPYSTGGLARAIHRVVIVNGREVSGEVRCDHPKAALVHDGARPHPIHPIQPGGTMVFYWRKVGRVVYFKRPHIRMHPGMKGKRFLSGPTEIVGRKHRLITITYGH